ncbi:hypothetical protein [Campylobacter geochelonis]|uniref:Uncharacterized protein n=1 Tax=Campylobacter geochelonis TaxID=1780362 RepID=A0A128EFY6_9BACT|nr:hypothetical protein [Campylobacter geochelonis]QKF71429.1 hypothetical protein CGEO_1126 [Campylobacter geochelonis]CZE47814.1 Uncharacterised protein [Campylobacter geochelonis]CZE48360.1 Uncharacterised protein [Campylobacter geochelonis]CZE50863.1 Uncharacterised protein [Campylobacter geochelonis]
MKVKDIYAMIAIIFATNFKGAIEEDKFKKLAPAWVLKNETDENKKAHEFWQKALKEDYSAVLKDFEELKKAFEMDFFKLISDMDVTLFFEKARYQKPFKELKASHSANMLAFLAAIFKSDTDEKTHNFLGLYLTNYFMESFRGLAAYLKANAKSDYYKALGWFLDDYLQMIKTTLGLKI